ncbi:DNA segregation ATPase FtsK/SpoIIIE, S-DNA-T family [Thermotomaculum hydrothermale]|uniref:DNA segregation ATPase FtsK/SpoIIIE, S-DNA-T family n=1 Tax=Thermotomaculum hydrothermale TaxID=981385 RepID=A0A7R6PFP4_9BACT|nr:DNA translocase FtsK [Thermotomaculum hydrothermale]BBB32883.1 DNA segregation ATPase FtsK/SpoIIIE, S-DNA-T family [Thermotomaculum hydrothermale]
MAKNEENFNMTKILDDIVAFVLIFIACIVFLSLISFSPSDPSLFTSDTVSKLYSNNLIGTFGANLSAILINMFGYASYLIVLFFLALSYLIFKHGLNPVKIFSFLGVFIIELISFATVLSLFLSDILFIDTKFTGKEYTSAGGIIGNKLQGILLPEFNFWGTLILILALIVITLIISLKLNLYSFYSILFVVSKKMVESIITTLKNFIEKRRKEITIKKIKTRNAPPKKPKPKPKPEKKVKEKRADKKQPAMKFEKSDEYNPPWQEIFADPDEESFVDRKELELKGQTLIKRLKEFKVNCQIADIHPGPIVTTYEIKLEPGIKFSTIQNLSNDLSIALAAKSIRVERTYGKPTISIEVPNKRRKLIVLKEIISSEKFWNSKEPLTLALGLNVTGEPFFSNLNSMPHLLIGGQTGSGKSVGLNAMICSLLVKNPPEMLKMIMVDPKMVELGVYSNIPHLLTDVIIDSKEAASALSWAVSEMERRYLILKDLRVRNLSSYNSMRKKLKGGEELEPLPYIVVVIDELADLMFVARAKVEESIARLAQKARAVGIHLILATQRPSRDIVTGVISSNMPSRICFKVTQAIDSRVVLDRSGAEQLLGKGDMLFQPPGTSEVIRLHAPFVSEGEVENLVSYLKSYGKPEYMDKIKNFEEAKEEIEIGFGDSKIKLSSNNPEYIQAVKLVISTGQASISYLQRKMSIGFNKAARYIEMMESDGIVGPKPHQGGKVREVLVGPEFLDNL